MENSEITLGVQDWYRKYKASKQSIINKLNDKNMKSNNTKLQEACEKLIEEVKQQKERGNITAIAINIGYLEMIKSF